MKDGIESLAHGRYTNMMPFLAKPRVSSKYKDFKYKKVQKQVIWRRGEKASVIAWEIYYNDSYITTMDTLKEVNHYIKLKAST